jgi:hypothetical protein
LRTQVGKYHNIKECPQSPVIADQGKSLSRLEESYSSMATDYKRVAIALETLAERGAQVDSLELRTNKLVGDLDECFGLYRDADKRLIAIELKAAEYKGKQEGKKEVENQVREEGKRFWTLLERLQLLTPILICCGFILYLLEKFGVIIWVVKQFQCFTGGK